MICRHIINYNYPKENIDDNDYNTVEIEENVDFRGKSDTRPFIF